MVDEADGSESVHANLTDLSRFSLRRILMESTDRKIVFVEAAVRDSSQPAVLIIEKLPFTAESVAGLLGAETTASQNFTNDVYGQYGLAVAAPHNTVKCNIIHPATEKHIAKYLDSPAHLVRESPALYHALTLPNIKADQFSLQWVYNVLDHKKEAERIIFEDPDPELGFILAPDFKWSGESVADLYCLAITHKRGLRSLRDLTAAHLPLLRNIRERSVRALGEKHGLQRSQLRLYLHYQPSYYHLHVHVTSLQFPPPGSGCEKAVLLDTVISNIERQSAFYQRAELCFLVRERELLYRVYSEAGHMSDQQDPALCFTAREMEPGRDGAATREFFQELGRAKHEPCGEFWNTSYGESGWRLGILALCLPGQLNTGRLLSLALASGLACLGGTTDENTEWEVKVEEVCRELGRLLPPGPAGTLADLFTEHAMVRRGRLDGSAEQTAYRSLLELEESLLRWEEGVKEGLHTAAEVAPLLDRMEAARLPGWQHRKLLQDSAPLSRLLQFLLQVSSLQRLQRTGWVRSGVRDPETDAGHMWRMAVMGLLVGGEQAAAIALVHDVAECVIGDLTPHCGVSKEEKAAREDAAYRDLVKELSGHIVERLYGNFRRFEDCEESDPEAMLVKDLDKYDMILQAWEYESRDKKGPYLQQFFDSTATVFQTVPVLKWQKELLAHRENHFVKSNPKV